MRFAGNSPGAVRGTSGRRSYLLCWSYCFSAAEATTTADSVRYHWREERAASAALFIAGIPQVVFAHLIQRWLTQLQFESPAPSGERQIAWLGTTSAHAPSPRRFSSTALQATRRTSTKDSAIVVMQRTRRYHHCCPIMRVKLSHYLPHVDLNGMGRQT
jgi:hypothetical protein